MYNINLIQLLSLMSSIIAISLSIYIISSNKDKFSKVNMNEWDGVAHKRCWCPTHGEPKNECGEQLCDCTHVKGNFNRWGKCVGGKSFNMW
jgi:hypothetical protein